MKLLGDLTLYAKQGNYEPGLEFAYKIVAESERNFVVTRIKEGVILTMKRLCT